MFGKKRGSKKAVSGVVVAVLLILISIVAVGVLAVVVMNFVKSNSSKLEAGINTIDLAVAGANYYYSPASGDSMNILVKRNVGEGNLSKIMFIIDTDKGSCTFKSDTPINELETKTILVPLSSCENYNQINKISVAPVVSVNGKDTPGSPTNELTTNGAIYDKTGLIGYWGFNGDSKDNSGNSHDATCTSCPTLTSDKLGNTNNAYNFNGNSNFLQIPYSSTLNSNEITVSAWIKDAPNQGDNRRDIATFGKFTGGSDNLAFDMRIDDYVHSGDTYPQDGETTNGLEVVVYQVCNGATGKSYKDSSKDLDDNKWHFVAFTFKPAGSGILSLYVDGKKISPTKGKDDSMTSICNPQYNLFIGELAGSGLYFNGAIDDVRIYSRALSDQEMQNLYTYG